MKDSLFGSIALLILIFWMMGFATAMMFHGLVTP
jgi:hypothetical protein